MGHHEAHRPIRLEHIADPRGQIWHVLDDMRRNDTIDLLAANRS
jgi:hypothetical protein